MPTRARAASLAQALRELAAGRWEAAHAIVQEDPSAEGAWAHGIVHLVEGDLGNARYWYERARRPFPGAGAGAVDTEIAALEAALEEAPR